MLSIWRRHGGRRQSGQTRNPLAAASVVIYATLGLLAVTIPCGPDDWSRDPKPGMLQGHLLPAAQEIYRLMQSIGIDRRYERARFSWR